MPPKLEPIFIPVADIAAAAATAIKATISPYSMSPPPFSSQ